MTNKLKQVEQAIEWSGSVIPNMFPTCPCEQTIKRALSLLKEVEEGKAHVMRWVSMKGKWCEPTETWLLHGGSESPFAGSGWDDEFINHHATFNNNNGEIPMPKGEGDV